jgi:hypothetical protein
LNVCEADCPTGFIESDGNCNAPTETEKLDNCFVWRQKEIEIGSGREGGDGQIELDAANVDSHPISAYERGLWFDGSDYVFLTGIILNT